MDVSVAAAVALPTGCCVYCNIHDMILPLLLLLLLLRPPALQ